MTPKYVYSEQGTLLRADGSPFGALATELERVGQPRRRNDRQWAWRDLLLEVTYLEEDANKHALVRRGGRPWRADLLPKGLWCGG